MRNVPVLCAQPQPNLAPRPVSQQGSALASILTLVSALTTGFFGESQVRAQPGVAAPGKFKSDEAAARSLFREAKELAAAGKSSQALEKYTAAYKLVPTPTLLWPIAELRLQLGQPVAGLEALRTYRQTVSPELMEPGQQLADADRLERRLLERAGKVRFNGSSGALLLIDGRELGRAPRHEPELVDPGSHRVDITTEKGTKTIIVEVGPGEERAVSDSEEAAASSTKPPENGPKWHYRIHPLPAVLFGLASGSLTAATVLGGLALDRTLALNEQCPDRICLGMQSTDLDSLNDSVTKQRSYSTAASALWGIGGVLLVSSVVLLAIDVYRQRSGHRLFSYSLTPRLEVAASGAKASSGLLLGGRF